MKENKNIICILGGMGPQAGAKMLEVMISIAAREFGAKNCEDFPEIVLFSLPVPDFIASKKNLKKALAMLREKVQIVNEMNVSLIAIACNTAHILLNDLQRFSRVPFISMIDAVADKVEEQNLNRVGILASPSAIRFGLFQQALRRRGIRVIVPNRKQLTALEAIIRKVIAGTISGDDHQRLMVVTESLAQRGAQGIILGCTELPLIFPSKFPLPVFDSIRITAQALLSRCFDSHKKGVIIN